MDLAGMGTDVLDGVMGVVNTVFMSGDMVTMGMAIAVIILSALFMSSLESLVSTTMTALFVYVVLGVVWAAYNADWDFAGPVNGTWESFAGGDALTFFTFFSYFLVFAVAIAIVNIVKGMVAG